MIPVSYSNYLYYNEISAMLHGDLRRLGQDLHDRTFYPQKPPRKYFHKPIILRIFVYA